MSPTAEARVAIVTGSGRGIGREHALELARQGVRVVVNDLGADLAGAGGSLSPAQEVVAAITDAGGEAVADGSDVASWEGSAALVQRALDAFGRLDAVVCNAGFLRDRMVVSTGEEELDAVLRVHVKGHFLVARHAAAHWREEAKAGRPVAGRIVNTTSGAGLWGSVGQAVYSAAKGAIATLTLVQSAELARYGVTANAIAPIARTRMTEEVFADQMAAPGAGGFDAPDPANVAPLVAWLASAASSEVTGRVFEVEGGRIQLVDGYRRGPVVDAGRRWRPGEVGDAVAGLLAEAPAPVPVYGAG